MSEETRFCAMCSACHATRSHLSFTPPFTPQNRRQTLGTAGSLRTDKHNVRACQHIKIYHSHYHSHHQRRRQKHPAVAGTGEHGSVREHNAHMCDKQTRLTRKTERKKIRFTLSFTPSAQHSGGGRSNSHRQSQMDEVGVRPCVHTHATHEVFTVLFTPTHSTPMGPKPVAACRRSRPRGARCSSRRLAPRRHCSRPVILLVAVVAAPDEELELAGSICDCLLTSQPLGAAVPSQLSSSSSSACPSAGGAP